MAVTDVKKIVAVYNSPTYTSTQYSSTVNGWTVDGGIVVVRKNRKTGLTTQLTSMNIGLTAPAILPNTTMGRPILVNTDCKFYRWITRPAKYKPCYLKYTGTGTANKITITDAATGKLIGYAMPKLGAGVLGMSGDPNGGFDPIEWNSWLDDFVAGVALAGGLGGLTFHTPQKASILSNLPKFDYWTSLAHSSPFSMLLQIPDQLLTSTDIYNALKDRAPYKFALIFGCNALQFTGNDFLSHAFTKDIQGSAVVGPKVTFYDLVYHSEVELWLTTFFNGLSAKKTYAVAFDEACAAMPRIGNSMSIYEGTRPIGSPSLDPPRTSHNLSLYVPVQWGTPQPKNWVGGSLAIAAVDTQQYYIGPYGVINQSVLSQAIGQYFRLMAVSDSSHRFMGWGGDINPLFAKQNPITIISNKDQSIYPIFTPLIGDANKDGVVNMQDVTVAERLILGYKYDAETIIRADTNGDGIVDMGDVFWIEKMVLGKIPVAPVDAPYLFGVGDVIRNKQSASSPLYQIVSMNTAKQTADGAGVYVVKSSAGTLTEISFATLLLNYVLVTKGGPLFTVDDLIAPKTPDAVWSGNWMVVAYDVTNTNPDVIIVHDLTGSDIGYTIVKYSDLVANYKYVGKYTLQGWNTGQL